MTRLAEIRALPQVDFSRIPDDAICTKCGARWDKHDCYDSDCVTGFQRYTEPVTKTGDSMLTDRLAEIRARVALTGKCIACGKRFEITDRIASIANDAGCVISPCCNFPSTIVKAQRKRARAALEDKP